MPTNHVAWSSIELLHNAVRTLTHLHELGQPFPVVTYRAKVKLHGSNCAVQIHADGVVAQSRTAILTVDADYKGFAAWVRTHEAYFRSLPPAVVFGEWCGPGVEKGMAISQVPAKQFAVFAIQLGTRVVFEPAALRDHLGSATPAALHVLPWQGDAVAIRYGDADALAQVATELSARTATVEREDPWVKATFGISGLGEGLVFYPIDVDGRPPDDDPESLARLMFKAKGDKHRTAGSKVAVQATASVVASVEDFVALMVTGPRLEQGLAAIGGVRDPKQTGAFLAWLVGDVKKESVAELEASGLIWAQVERAVSSAARTWFLAK